MAARWQHDQAARGGRGRAALAGNDTFRRSCAARPVGGEGVWAAGCLGRVRADAVCDQEQATEGARWHVSPNGRHETRADWNVLTGYTSQIQLLVRWEALHRLELQWSAARAVRSDRK